MFPFDQLGHAAKALVNEAEKVGTATVRTARDAVQWAGDVLAGNVGTQAMPVPEVVKLVLAGDSSSWFQSSDTARLASNEHGQIAAKLSNMLNNLEPAWTGKAAESARARTKTFTTVVDSVGSALNANGSNVGDSAHGFNQAKGSMDPMGDPPDKSFFDAASPWDTDTEKAIDEYNAKAQKNLGIYNSYAAHVDSQGQGLRTDYGQISPEFGSSSASPAEPSSVQARRDTAAGAKSTGGAPHTPVVTPPATPHPAAVSPGGAPGGSGPEGGQFVPGPGSSPQTGSEDTRAAARTPPSLLPGGLPPGSTVPFGPDGTTSVGNPQLTGGVDFLGGPGGGPGGSRLGTGEPGLPGGGRQTGARGIDEPGRGGAAGGRSAGSRVSGGMPGMVPGAARGAKEEDKERQRKYVQDEAGVFSEEDRKAARDPITGLPPAPPVIGA